MTFRKAVLAKATNLFEHALTKFTRNAFLLHARYQPIPMFFDAPRAPPRCHVAPQLIGFTRCVVSSHDRKLHDLFLKQWNT